MSAIETVTVNGLIIEYHRHTRNSLCIHQDDASGFFDRIITNHAIINSIKYHVPSNIYKVHCETQDTMTYATQINNRISKVSYTSTEKFKLHGVGQGADNIWRHWNFISIQMMEVIDKLAPGCTIVIPNNKKTWIIKIIGFVDDKRYYTNLLMQTIQESLIQRIKISVRLWDEFITFVDGKLELKSAPITLPNKTSIVKKLHT